MGGAKVIRTGEQVLMAYGKEHRRGMKEVGEEGKKEERRVGRVCTCSEVQREKRRSSKWKR